MDFLDTINMKPTTNEEQESSILVKQREEENKPTPPNPLATQQAGEGPDVAKMAGTPNARKGQLNAQEQRLDAAAHQDQQQVNPQGQQTAADYYRTQNIQDQTLGQAQEAANEWEQQMKEAGSSGAGNVSKYIMDVTNQKLTNAKNESYISDVMQSQEVRDKLAEVAGLDSDNLTDEINAELSVFIQGLLEGKEPEELNLAELEKVLEVDENNPEFTALVEEIQKQTYSTLQNLGDYLAEDIIDAEDVTLKVLMDEGYVDEGDIRDSLGLFNGEPLPDGWEEMSYAELEALAAQQFRDKSEELNKQAIMQGARFDAGGGYENAANAAEAREDLADTVQFGDSQMSLEDFLDNDRISDELNRFGTDFDWNLEGKALESKLEELFGNNYKQNPDYYHDLFELAKLNNQEAEQINTSAQEAESAISEAQMVVKEILANGADPEVLSDLFGLDLNNWDLESANLSQEEKLALGSVLRDYTPKLLEIAKSDPDFYATLVKEPDQSWGDYWKELQTKLGRVEQYDTVQTINKYFDADGNIVGDANMDQAMKDIFGVDPATLKYLIDNQQFDDSGTIAAWLADDNFPEELSDGVLTKDELKSLNLKGDLNMESLGELDLMKSLEMAGINTDLLNTIQADVDQDTYGFTNQFDTKTGDDIIDYGLKHLKHTNEAQQQNMITQMFSEVANGEVDPNYLQEVYDNYSSFKPGAKDLFTEKMKEYLTKDEVWDTYNPSILYGSDKHPEAKKLMNSMAKNTPELLFDTESAQPGHPMGGILYDNYIHRKWKGKATAWLHRGALGKELTAMKELRKQIPANQRSDIDEIITALEGMNDHIWRSGRTYTNGISAHLKGRGRKQTDKNRKTNGSQRGGLSKWL